MSYGSSIFQRTSLLLGEERMARLSQVKVILFGIGGVGSWCAESLVRSGVHHLTIVDSDRVDVSNINRQLHATTQTIGQVKTEVLRKRLLEINPEAEIVALQKIYSIDSSPSFELETYDVIIDAIDSLSSKIHLIREATRTSALFVSSMGASLKVDPARVRTGEFWEVKGCPLASAIRKRIKRGDLPAKKFMCVFSDEVLPNAGTLPRNDAKVVTPAIENVMGDPELANHDWNAKKAVINGTMVHVTAIFGFTLAGLVLKHFYNQYS